MKQSDTSSIPHVEIVHIRYYHAGICHYQALGESVL